MIPDTRQLRESERGTNYKPQDEKIEIAAVADNQITLPRRSSTTTMARETLKTSSNFCRMSAI